MPSGVGWIKVLNLVERKLRTLIFALQLYRFYSRMYPERIIQQQQIRKIEPWIGNCAYHTSNISEKWDAPDP